MFTLKSAKISLQDTTQKTEENHILRHATFLLFIFQGLRVKEPSTKTILPTPEKLTHSQTKIDGGYFSISMTL